MPHNANSGGLQCNAYAEMLCNLMHLRTMPPGDAGLGATAARLRSSDPAAGRQPAIALCRATVLVRGATQLLAVAAAVPRAASGRLLDTILAGLLAEVPGYNDGAAVRDDAALGCARFCFQPQLAWAACHDAKGLTGHLTSLAALAYVLTVSFQLLGGAAVRGSEICGCAVAVLRHVEALRKVQLPGMDDPPPADMHGFKV